MRSPQAGKVEGNAAHKQSDWKVHKHHVLRVLCQQNRSQIKWVHHSGRSLSATYWTMTFPTILGWIEQ